MATSRTKPVEDWRFLAAFGIPDLGVGDSRKLLQHVALEDILNVDTARLQQIKGFGQEKSNSIPKGVAAIKDLMGHMLALEFNLRRTPILAGTEPDVSSPISGKKLVFSGKMEGGDRRQMQEQARQLGAQVQSAVSGATDMLICGSKVGASKLNKATKMGVQILSEAEYLLLINQGR